MIKLTKSNPTESETVIHVDGVLAAEALHELRALIGTPGSRVTLDLKGLTSLDPAGRKLLIELSQSGCVVLGASLYVRSLLQEV